MKLLLYKSRADMDAGIALEEIECDTLRKTKDVADMISQNGYWAEVFYPDGELACTAYPKE